MCAAGEMNYDREDTPRFGTASERSSSGLEYSSVRPQIPAGKWGRPPRQRKFPVSRNPRHRD